MRKTFKINILAASVLAVTSFAAIAEETKDAEVTKDDGISSTIDLSFRYRIETVDQVGFDKDAEASTVRTRATIKTKWTDNIDSVLEFDDVTEVVLDNFNSAAGTSTANRNQYPVIADPQGAEVNQAFVRYTTGNTKIAAGRQRILIGTERYVGGVGWRQNEQTYDSFTLRSNPTKDFSFNYSYVYNVNRIFGEGVAAGDNDHNTHLFNTDYKMAAGKLSGYYFAIDNNDVLVFSSKTLGIRFDGKLNDLSYTLEYATQSDAADNPNNYNVDYYLFTGNYKVGKASFGAGVEVLGGDVTGGQGFTTSLATLHAFQGWADVFLATPKAGIQDATLTATYNLNGYKFKGVYHDFNTDQGDVDLGTEIDLVATKKLTNNLSGMLKFAFFNSADETNYKSRDKMWLMFTYKL